MATIQKELGEEEEVDSESQELLKRLEEKITGVGS